jgi:hypothetical protein
LTGLHRDNIHLYPARGHGRLVVDRDLGALHESSHRVWLGPPKTPASARTIELPPFLVRLLADHLTAHPYPFVFTARTGCWLRRSTFDRRVFRPAVDGNTARVNPAVRIWPVCPGLTSTGCGTATRPG